MRRAMNFQSVAWFYDLSQRGLLDLNPPYQRRSVWNQDYKDYFIDTVLNGYPAPAIFLYQHIEPSGVTTYSVVDGKQRLCTLFEFADNRFAVAEDASITKFRGLFFKDLDDDVKREFWGYQFAVEYVPTTDEAIINNIFDRINRNVARLTRQELRHAKFGGEFITEAERLTDWMFSFLPPNFPNINQRSRSQMKDIELVAQLLLLTEVGPRAFSQDDLDQSFSDRDTAWENKDTAVAQFEATVRAIHDLLQNDDGAALARTRLRNQADFYSLFGAIHALQAAGASWDPSLAAQRLLPFIETVDDEAKRKRNRDAGAYYQAARSSSSDTTPRQDRIRILASVIEGPTRSDARGRRRAAAG